ncbi:hypothetical protein CUP1735 [Campylobacter upsaliensis RM3195]|nr:hypothetical protein CUP1735 [Campylobacter upsaliensis RM3195]
MYLYPLWVNKLLVSKIHLQMIGIYALTPSIPRESGLKFKSSKTSLRLSLVITFVL